MAEDTRDNLSLTDEEDNDDLEDEYALPELQGSLSKWTNYIHGWQDRYIVLKDGTLSYYKSENETAFGCRGAVSLNRVVITAHEFDECRFDVSVNDCLWYLRAETSEERQQWINAIELHKQVESGYGSENNLRRHGSLLSLTSGTSLSTASTSSFKRGRGLREKLAEMDTFKDILCRQVDSLQSYFDACSSAVAQTTIHDMVNDDIDDVDELESPLVNGSHSGKHNFVSYDGPREKDIVNILQQHGAHAIDFKGEAFTFKATTAGILSTLSHCLDLMSQREEAWRKRLEREVDKRKKIEDAYKALLQERPKPILVGGPDYEEGPHSLINEEEFFDAIDASMDKLEKEEEHRVYKVQKPSSLKPPTTSLDESHPLYTEIEQKVAEHLRRTHSSPEDPDSFEWQLFLEEGEMKVYKRDLHEDGMIIYPVKAVHTITSVTAHEFCQFFWDPDVRLEWDSMLESCSPVEYLSKDTVITYQTHRRVWPSTQRDSLFWSTIRHCPGEDDEGPDTWLVVNFTCPHSDAPLVPKCVRIRINVGLICQTIIQPPERGKEITRDNLTCKIHYSAYVNPGGWAPQSVIRMVARREVPKFLKIFSRYVQEKTADHPILF